MYLHLGQDQLINSKDIIGVFDLDTTTVSKNTRETLAKAEKTHRVVNVSMELPKSFVLTVPKKKRNSPQSPPPMVYVSQLSSATLKGRYEANSL